MPPTDLTAMWLTLTMSFARTDTSNEGEGSKHANDETMRVKASAHCEHREDPERGSTS